MFNLSKLKKLIKEESDSKALAAELFVRCRESATVAHKDHITTNNYATHIALGEFYNGLPGLADSFIESYIGRFGKIKEFNKIEDNEVHGIENVKSLREWIDKNRKEISVFSEHQNLIDTIVELCDTTLYKLENLS